MSFPIQVVQELIISYPTGSTAIQIGPGPVIEFFDTSNNLIMELSPPTGPNGTVFQVNHSPVSFIIGETIGTGSNPGMQWTNAKGSLDIFVVTDANGDLGMVIEGDTYTDGDGNSAQQTFNFLNDYIELGAFVAGTSNQDGGHLVLSGAAGASSSGRVIDMSIWNTGALVSGWNVIRTNLHDWRLFLDGQNSTAVLDFTIDGNDYAYISNLGAPWTTLTMANGWHANGAPFILPAYKRDALGNVMLQGVMAAGTKTNGTVVATLPVGFRPTATTQLLASADGTISPFNCVLHIDTSGNVTVFGLGTAGVIGLDGLSFPTL